MIPFLGASGAGGGMSQSSTATSGAYGGTQYGGSASSGDFTFKSTASALSSAGDGAPPWAMLAAGVLLWLVLRK